MSGIGEGAKSLSSFMEIEYLIPGTTEFFLSDGGFLMIRKEEKTDRAYLSRIFPHEMPYGYISVADSDKNEIGIIKALSDFDKETEEILKNDLRKKYYAPKIIRIDSINERFGYSYWEVETDNGKRSFSLKDTFRSLMKVSDDRLFVIDVDSNRYEIESIKALDRKSYRKIELYI